MGRKGFLLMISLLAGSIIYAQNDSVPAGYVIYTPAFKFRDGIFLNFEQVKINKPIPKAQIVSEIDYNSFDFFEKLFENDEIELYDELGVKQKVKIEKIWGFSDKGILFVNLNDDFHRIPVFGSISHFIADKTYVDYPYHYNPYSTYYRYDSYYYSDDRNTKTVMLQYLLDFETGKVYEFDVKSTEYLLSKDPDLFEEFSKLSGRKKNKLKFLYVRKYDQKHPVYFPIN
jgi:hypothetical protein